MHRFCCPEAAREGDHVRVEGAAAGQMRRVLRLGPGDQVLLFGLDEWEYTVRLERLEGEVAHGTILARASPATEPRCRLTLAFACLKGEKCEWVLQKGTELGVSCFLLMQTQRTVVTPDERRTAGRRERYARIVREATEQCGRLRPPSVDGILRFEQVLAQSSDLALICHERAAMRLGEVFGVRCSVFGPASTAGCPAPTLASTGSTPSTPSTPSTDPTPNTEHRTPSTVLLLVGPEGGFTEEEVSLAQERGARPVSLGPRVLRAETAALAAVALAMEALEGE